MNDEENIVFSNIVTHAYTEEDLDALDAAADKAEWEQMVKNAAAAIHSLCDHITESTQDPYLTTAAIEIVLADYQSLLDGDEE